MQLAIMTPVPSNKYSLLNIPTVALPVLQHMKPISLFFKWSPAASTYACAPVRANAAPGYPTISFTFVWVWMNDSRITSKL